MLFVSLFSFFLLDFIKAVVTFCFVYSLTNLSLNFLNQLYIGSLYQFCICWSTSPFYLYVRHWWLCWTTMPEWWKLHRRSEWFRLWLCRRIHRKKLLHRWGKSHLILPCRSFRNSFFFPLVFLLLIFFFFFEVL